MAVSEQIERVLIPKGLLGDVIAIDISLEDYMAHYAEEHCEWIDGVVIKMSGSVLHNKLLYFLYQLFGAYFELRPIGQILGQPLVMRLPAFPKRRRLPDLMIILNSNPHPVRDTYVDGAPDICIEVVSEESIGRDHGDKFREYEQGGVPEYWILDPLHRETRFYRLNDEGRYVRQSEDAAGNYRTPTLPGLALYVPLLWQEEFPGPAATASAVADMLADAPENDHSLARKRQRRQPDSRRNRPALVQTCPPALADEIALVGSTAHGFADDESDLELNLWAEAIPPLDARIAWLEAAGASDIHVEETPRPDNSYWIGFHIGAIPGEVGWQTFAALDETIDHLLTGRDIDYLGFGYILTGAIALRTHGRLQNWQEVLDSDPLQRILIDVAVENWTWPNGYVEQRRLVRRGERLKLTEYLLIDLHQAMSVLYAVNRRWHPSSKWTLTVAREFAPFDLDARIDAILGDPSLERRVELCATLCLDVLALVPDQYDVSAAIAALRVGLEA